MEQIWAPWRIEYILGDKAGAGLKDHIHQHVVPRWIGDTRVMPQALTEQYDALKPLFNS